MSKLMVNYLTTSIKMPFYLSIISLSVQIKAPCGVSSIPIAFRTSAFAVGSSFKSSSRVRYLGGGHSLSYGYLGSTNEFKLTALVDE
jgi:hypothetical protein